jgi:hypothetical protein
MDILLANPWGLLALAALPALVVIHSLRQATRRVPTSTLFLLDHAGPEPVGGLRLDSFRQALPFWMQVLASLALTWLLVEPRFIRADSRQTVAVVLDSSASMVPFRDATLTALKRQLRRLKAVAGHGKEPQFLGRSESVLLGPQNPKRMVSITLERDHCVDDVLKHPRTGELPILGDVADEQEGGAVGLCHLNQTVGAFAYLRDRPGRRGELGVVEGLDGVHHAQLGPLLLEVVDDVGQRGLGREQEVVVERAQPLCTQPHLVRRLLTRDVQDLGAGCGTGPEQLEHEGGLADPGLATDEGDAPRHQTAAEHPVELSDAGGNGLAVRRADRGDGHRGR